MINRLICFFKGHEWKLDKKVVCYFAIPLECQRCGKFKFSFKLKYIINAANDT